MNLQERIDLLADLGEYILSDPGQWQQVREHATRENSWFIPQFTALAAHNIAHSFLQKEILQQWTAPYEQGLSPAHPRTIGIVMAGNIPLVGFHDLLCVFISGHKALIKPSSRDKVLIGHLCNQLMEWNPAVKELISFTDLVLKGCDAYIATGSNNTAGYFEYYFGKYPHLIRRNRTSVALLTGQETAAELELLADDVYLYFGRGCRNVTKLYVPDGYDFPSLLSAFKKYDWLATHHKYKNNYDYNLALHILNKQFYMSNDSLLLVENSSVFSPISQLNFEFYSNIHDVVASLKGNTDLQCIVGKEFIPFGSSQHPSISDYADGTDTMAFLAQLSGTNQLS